MYISLLERDTDQYLGVVFPESEGLISFLGNSKWDKKYNKSKEAALDLIRWTVSRVDKSWREGVVPYAERLRVGHSTFIFQYPDWSRNRNWLLFIKKCLNVSDGSSQIHQY